MKITMKYHSIQIQSEQDSDIDTLLQDLPSVKKSALSLISKQAIISQWQLMQTKSIDYQK